MQIDFNLKFRTTPGQKFSLKTNLDPAIYPDRCLVEMDYLNSETWTASIQLPNIDNRINYRYQLTDAAGEVTIEGEKDRYLAISRKDACDIVVHDTWNATGAIENSFYTAPFAEVFNKEHTTPKLKKPKSHTHIFQVKAPLLGSDECVCVLGNDTSLGTWDSSKCLLLETGKDWHAQKVDLSTANFPIIYKYGIYNFKRDEFVRFEGGEDRVLLRTGKEKTLTILHDGFVRVPSESWRGAGVAIPVFSLRSANSFGIGEFLDIKLLVDWAALTGLKLIQLLPINDTSATFTKQDSYPYAAISAFALHPVYMNLQKVAGKKFAAQIKSLHRKGKQLNALPDVDYEQVIYYKMNTLRELYEHQGDDFLKEEGYKTFFDQNQHWLKPYAAFCMYRDRHGSADFRNWRAASVYNATDNDKLTATKTKTAREVRFYYFVQYHLHLQLTEAVDYAHKKGIVLKGDVPIGIFRNSVDAWTSPELYNMNWQAGAPPDDFAVKGQNWGFPTYNWQKMGEDDFSWWRQRFDQMKYYFDAFRIDHILGFFRIWSIPMDAVEGILGRFVPALPVHVNEFAARGIRFDNERFCKPYITDGILEHLFGNRAVFVRDTYLSRSEDGTYTLLDGFNTQQKVADHFEEAAADPDADQLRSGLYDIISNVVFFEEENSDGKYFHFRISMEHTTSFQLLDESTKAALRGLYIDYFYHRQDHFWREEALRKLPRLKEATDMLICGEDLGMVPHSVPGVMKDLGILSLEIQRMPKNPQTEFFHPKDAPYLSVVTPSTHDMSPIRVWWEAERGATQRFYNTMLESSGEAPYFCESWISRAVVLQHLYSPAMWSIFQLQDLLAMSESLRRENPHEERINNPADPKFYWRYRMHISLEDLLKESSFNAELHDYVRNSGRK